MSDLEAKEKAFLAAGAYDGESDLDVLKAQGWRVVMVSKEFADSFREQMADVKVDPGSCSTCRFWFDAVCRRYPPTYTVTFTRSDDWCGEHSPLKQ